MGGEKNGYDCIKAFSETDFTEDLKKIRRAQLWSCTAKMTRSCRSAPPPRMSAKLVKNAMLKIYPGFHHGMPTTNADQINGDLSRIRQEKPASQQH